MTSAAPTIHSQSLFSAPSAPSRLIIRLHHSGEIPGALWGDSGGALGRFWGRFGGALARLRGRSSHKPF
jgi:hypothetical protein